MVMQRDGRDAFSPKIDKDHRMHIHAVTEGSAQKALEIGNDYNINTGIITLSTSNPSGILYFKNNENSDLVVRITALGLGTGGSPTDAATVTLIKNPTGGTLISNAVDVDIFQNLNAGSANELLSSVAYKGVEGDTVTGGEEWLLFTETRRLVSTTQFILAKGNAVGLTVNPFATGPITVYAAMGAYIRNEASED